MPRRRSPEERAKLFKALSDPRRIELVDALVSHGPQCGTELAERLGISLALLCHHWEVLVDAGVVAKKRVGQHRYCSIDIARLREAMAAWDAGGERATTGGTQPPARRPRKSRHRSRS
jgi:ArsR family transcriptional regulator, arsenate/arsenite/antimonite-responsive transcriptional repressor